MKAGTKINNKKKGLCVFLKFNWKLNIGALSLSLVAPWTPSAVVSSFQRFSELLDTNSQYVDPANSYTTEVLFSANKSGYKYYHFTLLVILIEIKLLKNSMKLESTLDQ